MSTPQSILYDIQYKINTLNKLLEGNEEEGDLFEKVNEILKSNREMISAISKIEELLSLLIKLLSK